MTPIIKCIITDDEPIARKGLQGYIEKIDFLQLVGVCEDAIQLNSLLKQQTADLLFLDIEMPYVTGIDFLRNTPQAPKVIFTTAYEQYAIKGHYCPVKTKICFMCVDFKGIEFRKEDFINSMPLRYQT